MILKMFCYYYHFRKLILPNNTTICLSYTFYNLFSNLFLICYFVTKYVAYTKRSIKLISTNLININKNGFFEKYTIRLLTILLPQIKSTIFNIRVYLN